MFIIFSKRKLEWDKSLVMCLGMEEDLAHVSKWHLMKYGPQSGQARVVRANSARWHGDSSQVKQNDGVSVITSSIKGPHLR